MQNWILNDPNSGSKMLFVGALVGLLLGLVFPMGIVDSVIITSLGFGNATELAFWWLLWRSKHSSPTTEETVQE